MIEQAIELVDNQLIIHSQFFVHKDYNFTYRELLLDVFAQHYCGQNIVIHAGDGENLELSGFVDYINFIAEQFNIPSSTITFSTHGDKIEPYMHHKKILGIFVIVNNYLKNINKDLSNAKFVGSALGRINLTRIRLAYELDRVFSNDSYLIFQPNSQTIQNQLKHFSELYKKEFTWLDQRVFDRDLTSTHYNGNIDWQQSCESYANIWNQYLIEIVSETDAMSNYWFTEKTARCLATGKPFVLVAGAGSLERLQSMGFKTFGSIIDESYDQEIIPARRINRLIMSLNDLYNSPNRQQKIEEMYSIAESNIELYKNYIQNAREQ